MIGILVGMTLILSACVPGPRVVGTPGISLSEDRVFVAYGSYVYGLNVTSGAVEWHYPEEGNNQVVFYAQPYVTDEFIYVGDLANNFHKINKETGTPVWTFTGARGFYIGPASEENGMVYAPSNDGNLYAIDADGNLEWAFETGHYLWAQPLIGANAIFIGAMDNFVYAISKGGDQIWSTELAGAVVASPIFNDDESRLFVGSIGQEMVALNTADGSVLWTFVTEDSVWGRGLFADGTLYFADSGGNLYALNPNNGDQLWRQEFSGSVVGGISALPDGLALATREGAIKTFTYDGTPKWEAALTGEIYQAPAVSEEFLVAGTIEGDSLVYAYNMAGNQLWSITPEK